VSHQEWIVHRKLRKKIASAKWYAKKKEREIVEQQIHRTEIQSKLDRARENQSHLIWPDPVRRAEWLAVTAHLCLGYPVRPESVCPLLWRSFVERIEYDMGRLREEVGAVHAALAVWMSETFVLKIFRQLAIRECRALLDTHTNPPFGSTNLPRAHKHPHQQDRLWTTSLWNWTWVMTHLGNHREMFPVYWNHLCDWSWITPHPIPDPVELLRDCPGSLRWLLLMTENLSNDIHPAETERTEQSEDVSEETNTSTQSDETSQRYCTQPNTPDWDLIYSDCDSESIPSSLDTFLNDTFAHDNTEYR
jgi:hypothetical protein